MPASRAPGPSDPTSWEFTGPNGTVGTGESRTGPPGSAPTYPRHLGYRAYAGTESGCLASSVATLIGLRAPLVAAAMGEKPDIAAARRVVELWSGEHTLTYFEAPPEWTPLPGKLVMLYRCPEGSGRRRARDESGRFLSLPVHAAVVHGDDASLYFNPHDEAWPEPTPLGYLQVTFGLPVPSYLERTA